PAGVGDPVLVVINVDPHHDQAGRIDLDLAAIGFDHATDYDVVDRFGGGQYRWQGNDNYVELSPWGAPAHVFTLHRTDPDHEGSV
ncbi:MAG: hypothetical protein WKF60_12845, partial [Ilumatobacter sp.]